MRFGIFSFLGRGHLDPAIALGRGLCRRGHSVTMYHLSIAQVAIRRAGLNFAAIDRFENDTIMSRYSEKQVHHWSSTLMAIGEQSRRILREGPGVVSEEKVDAVVSDQLDIAAGSVAEYLNIPHISVSCSPPIFLDDSVPPPYCDFTIETNEDGERNHRANALVERLAEPLISSLNEKRLGWGLKSLHGVNDLFSKRAIITQMPRMLELPRHVPSHLYYTAQFRDDSLDQRIPFDWHKLTGKPLVFASLGTIRNTSIALFRAIAMACSRFEGQLVLSLGGGSLLPKDLGFLKGEPIIVNYAPQRELVKMSTVVINCAGLNTTLECLRNGVPMIAIPIGEDQPGVAARIRRLSAGVVIPVAFASEETISDALHVVLSECKYRSSVRSLREHLSGIDGVETAITCMERVT